MRKEKWTALLIAVFMMISGVTDAATPQRSQRSKKATARVEKTITSEAANAPKTASPESWRKMPPAPAPERPLRLPAAREVKLGNGLVLIMIEDHRAPLVTFNLGIPVGDTSDPVNQTGLAEATAALVTEGAAGRSSRQVDTEVETLGGQLSATSNDDYTEIYGSVVSENIGRLLEILGDVVVRPDFPESEVALYKKNREQKLILDRQDPEFLANEQFYKAVYGAHPYAILSPTPEAIESINRAKVRDFYQTHYSPAGAVLVITGDFDAAATEAKLRAAVGNWQAVAVTPPTYPAMPASTKRHIYLIDRPSSEQADFRIGNLGVARSNADFFPLLVANAILGDGTGSRLFLNIREKKGYSYDVTSSVNAPLMRGVFYGASETRTAVTIPAIREMLAEFDRVRNEPVSELDLQNAKNYLAGLFSLSLSTQGGLADRIVQERMLGLPPNYLETYRQRVNAVTVDQVQEVSRKYIQSANAAIVVVGDAAKLKRALSSLGKIEITEIVDKSK